MKKNLSLIIVLILILIGCLLSLTIGTIPVSFSELWTVLSGHGSMAQELIVYTFRFPRLLISLLAGIGLGVAGYLLQNITHNELADPGILGINAGAGLTVLLYLSFLTTNDTGWMLPFVACFGSLVAALLVYLCGQKNQRIVPNRLLLAGVAVNAGISALTLIGTVKASTDKYQFVVSWLAGTIWGTTWQHVYLLLPWLIILLPLVLSQGRKLEVLALGDDVAIGLGIRLKSTQLFFLFCGVCLAAVSVSVAGSISFIGLIAPHIAAGLIGKRNNVTLIMTGLVGALLLLYSDVLARVLLTSGELATGIVVSIIGAPYFIFQLLHRKR